ncbi:DUF4142 domain-containing protein [Sphingomonas arantia]|uniref:DUF4142 domain-containing protein n=1 Tax=Sphingomonas arantia TaxID=1460676 RepID=A0ABW4TUV0_9SPHN
MFKPALILAALVATPAFAQAPETPATFVMKAGASDLYEKQSSQSVLKTTKNPGVRSFAQMMITDHGKTTATVMAAAKTAGIRPAPPKLDAPKAQMIADLNRATGPARDALYLQQQATAHQEALALHQGYSTSGTQPALKAAATKAVPIVQHHIEMISAIKPS